MIDFKIFIGNLDLFHEGLWITSAYNYLKTNQFWQSSYIDRGLFGNYFPLLLWNDSKISIGSVRFSSILLLLINKIFLLLLAKQISENIKFEEVKKIIFFILLSLLFISEVGYLSPGQIVDRSALLLLFLNILLFALKDSNKYSYLYFIIGLFSVLSILWYLDIGAYINFSIAIILLLFFLKKDFKTIISILFGIIAGWIIFLKLINPNEINDFIFNSIKIYQTMDQIHGLIYPAPFFSGDTRATKAVLFFVLGGVFTIFICLNKNKFNTNNKIFFLILFSLSIAAFKTGLSRSDEPHIKSGSGPLLLVLYSYILYWLMNLSKFEYFENIIKYKKKLFVTLFLFVLILNFKLHHIRNIQYFPKNLDNLLNANDEAYLTDDKKKYIKLIDYYNQITQDLDCIQILTDEIILPYLLKKKTCTKYYEIWIARPNSLQIKFINDLKINKPKIILKTDKIQFTPKLKLVEEFIDKNYVVHSVFEEWIFMKIKE